MAPVSACHAVAASECGYGAHGYGWVGDVLPGFFFGLRFLEVELWQWWQASPT